MNTIKDYLSTLWWEVQQTFLSFFCSNGEFQPVYFWITTYAAVGLIALVRGSFGLPSLNATELVSLLVFILGFAFNYNQDRKNKVGGDASTVG